MQKRNTVGWLGLFIVFAAVLLSIATSWVLYEHTVVLLTENLRERLKTIAITTAVDIDGEDVEKLQIENDWRRPEWTKVISKMKKVREGNEDIIFMYIFRKKQNDPTQMEFVADSHSINPYANTDNDPTNNVDVDRNGVIDDTDVLQWPGQEYPEPPDATWEAFDGPTSNKELYTDAWGTYFTGYSPIKNSKGETVAALAVDVRADEFFVITRQTLYPFLTFIAVLILILLILSGGIIRIWNKRVELVVELDRQKDELLGIITHQLATPATAIRWQMESLLDGDAGKISKEQKEIVESTHMVTKRLVDLITMILDVSRIQLGKMKVEKQELDINAFFKELVTVIEPKAIERKVKFIKKIPEKLPVAMLDKRLTNMTLENLLSNAVKYTPEGGTVEFAVEQKNNRLYCTVRDTGMGIPEKDQSQIFGKLYRASNVRNEVDGNGFGLYVAKGAVEGQGGAIRFESKEGKGTTFYVELPLK